MKRSLFIHVKLHCGELTQGFQHLAMWDCMLSYFEGILNPCIPLLQGPNNRGNCIATRIQSLTWKFRNSAFARDSPRAEPRSARGNPSLRFLVLTLWTQPRPLPAKNNNTASAAAFASSSSSFPVTAER